jgi:hypothetical protein
MKIYISGDSEEGIVAKAVKSLGHEVINPAPTSDDKGNESHIIASISDCDIAIFYFGPDRTRMGIMDIVNVANPENPKPALSLRPEEARQTEISPIIGELSTIAFFSHPDGIRDIISFFIQTVNKERDCAPNGKERERT